MQKANKWTTDSTIQDVLQSNLGYELLSFITYYSGKSVHDLDHFFIRKLPLKSYRLISRLTGIEFDRRLIRWLIAKLTNEDAYQMTLKSSSTFKLDWWKESVIYHIFVPSFSDSDGDGYGDLRGIIDQFEYILSLNIDALLLSPIFASPFHDAGYDISDFKSINPLMGSLEDLTDLLEICHKNQIKLILTFPLNQTSDEHPWFSDLTRPQESGQTSPYKDYYINRESPNNWQSHYNESAWRYERFAKGYYLHLKSNREPDLNWHKPEVRQAMIEAMLFWRELGIDGLFLESLSIIAKQKEYPDGSKGLANLTGISGIEHYTYQPDLFDWIEEIYGALKRDHPDFLVLSDNQRMHRNYSRLMSGDGTGRSDLGLSYLQFENPGERRYSSQAISLPYLAKTCLELQKDADCSFWPVLYCEDPKHPRIVSRISSYNHYRSQVAKLVASLLLTGRGTVIVYQGQELGQMNAPFHKIEQIRDIMSLNKYEELNERPGVTDKSSAFDMIIRGCRDHARTPFVWDNSPNNGFSTSYEPWINCFADPGMSMADQNNDSYSVLNYYRSLISLRSHFTTLVYGEICQISPRNKNIYRLLRYDENHAFYIEMNLTDDILNVSGMSRSQLLRLKDKLNLQINVPQKVDDTILLSNYPDRSQQDLIKNSVLRPYESFILKLY